MTTIMDCLPIPPVVASSCSLPSSCTSSDRLAILPLKSLTACSPSPKRPFSCLYALPATRPTRFCIVAAHDEEAAAAHSLPSRKPSFRPWKQFQVQPKQKVVLKFVWLEKNIGLALEQVLPGYGTFPLTQYYFWPQNDAWEELKAKLESKPWISRRNTIVLLNQATDIINLWQQKVLEH